MFFADKVILYEGSGQYIVEAVALYRGKYLNLGLGKNWLNDLNISVIVVGGKGGVFKIFEKVIG